MTPLLAAVFASVVLQSYRGVPDPPVNVRVVDNILAEFLAGPVNPFTAAAATEALSIIVGLLDTSSPDNGHKEVGAAVRAAIKSLGEALLEMQVGPNALKPQACLTLYRSQSARYSAGLFSYRWRMRPPSSLSPKT